MRREAYKKLQDGWLNNGDKVPPAEFAKDLNLLVTFFLWYGVVLEIDGIDLIKWDKAKIGYYVRVDIAEGSVQV
ncbi:mRNA cap guanine-N7 methyltransferase 1 [Ananas comosus]|uniref:mRNA cap guanine-N7 methyltransferase 1 n=1 Tax=Ananas comosus TaxID=4615 RepID=A0A199V9C9_ANACO|nr:mRNA cap guanine-N7 methyltransferase 1 [Ananas comosus]